MEGGKYVRADPVLGQYARNGGGQADRLEARVDGEGDPRPARALPDDRHTFGFADQREGVAQGRGLGCKLEAIFNLIEHGREPGEQSGQVGLAAQASFLSRLAMVRSRSALSRMKPAASRWL